MTSAGRGRNPSYSINRCCSAMSAEPNKGSWRPEVQPVAVLPRGCPDQSPAGLPSISRHRATAVCCRQEDQRLCEILRNLGGAKKQPGFSWSDVARTLGGRRTGKSCRLRWRATPSAYICWLLPRSPQLRLRLLAAAPWAGPTAEISVLGYVHAPVCSNTRRRWECRAGTTSCRRTSRRMPSRVRRML